MITASWSLKTQPVEAAAPRFAAEIKTLCRAVCVNVLLFAFALWAVTPGFETNDDLSMQLIASGFYTGHPSEYLVFSNVLLGWPLRLLYETWPTCNWYIVYLITSQYAAMTAIAFVVFSRRRHWLFLLLYLGFFLLVEMRLLVSLQFTTTAFLVGASALILLVSGLRPGAPIQPARTLCGFALAGLMLAIREQAAALLIVCALPFLVERFGVKAWRRLLAVLLGCAALFLFLHGINKWYYGRDAAWNEFAEFNRLRGQIHWTRLERYLPQAAPAVGWSRNDADMFLNYYFAEPDVYASVPKMRTLCERLRALARSEPVRWDFRLRDLNLPELLDGPAGTLMSLALLNMAACVMAAKGVRRRILLASVSCYFLFAGLALYLALTARLPQRVALVFPLIANAACLYWTIDRKRDDESPVPVDSLANLRLGHGGRGLAFLFALTAWFGAYIWFGLNLAEALLHANAANRELRTTSQQIFEPLKALSPNSKPLLIAMPRDSVFEQCLLFQSTRAEALCSVLPYGWLTHSPVFRQVLNRYELHPYSQSLLDRGDVFFLMEPRWLEPLKTFYREHYQLDVHFRPVLDTDQVPGDQRFHLHLYKLRSSEG